MHYFIFEFALAVACCVGILIPGGTRAQAIDEPALPDGLRTGVDSRVAAALPQHGDREGGFSVEALVRMALRRNAGFLATRQQAVEAQGLLRQAGFLPNPGFDVGVTTGSFLGSRGERDISVGYAHTFELGGKRARRRNVAGWGTRMAQLAIDDRARLLKADIRMQYGKALAAVRNLETIRELLTVTRQDRRIAEARGREGEAPLLEQGLLQVAMDRLASDRVLLENRLTRAKLTLKTLAGMDIDAPLRLAGDLDVPPLSLTLADAMEHALTSRPDLRAMQMEVARTADSVRGARARAIPDVIAGVRYTRVDSRFDQFGSNEQGARAPLRDTDNLFTAVISITLPVLNRNQGNIQAAQARHEAAQLRLRYREAVVRREVRAAYSRYEASARALQIFNSRVIDRSQDNLRIVRAAYDLGEVRATDVIIEQRRMLETRQAYTDVLKEYYLAQAELERAAGGSLR